MDAHAEYAHVEDTVNGLPPYALMMAAYHRAYAPTLCRMLDSLPLRAADHVLDLACGDGAYSHWLAERVTPGGMVTAVDISRSWLEVAGQMTAAANGDSNVVRCQADAEHLPFANGAFDAAWCAQSFYSLPDALAALLEMKRVVRVDGVVAVFENDALHHILLPWPVDLELQVRQAELQAFEAQCAEPERYYVGRRLRPLMEEAGFVNLVDKPFATSRSTPVTGAARTFFTEYLETLRRRVAPYLMDEELAHLDTLVSPERSTFLLDAPGLSITCVDQLIWGEKPRKSNGGLRPPRHRRSKPALKATDTSAQKGPAVDCRRPAF